VHYYFSSAVLVLVGTLTVQPLADQMQPHGRLGLRRRFPTDIN